LQPASAANSYFREDQLAYGWTTLSCLCSRGCP
jgi:hypothetical protein